MYSVLNKRSKYILLHIKKRNTSYFIVESLQCIWKKKKEIGRKKSSFPKKLLLHTDLHNIKTYFNIGTYNFQLF